MISLLKTIAICAVVAVPVTLLWLRLREIGFTIWGNDE